MALVTELNCDIDHVGRMRMPELPNALRLMFTRELDRYARDFLPHAPSSALDVTGRDQAANLNAGD